MKACLKSIDCIGFSNVDDIIPSFTCAVPSIFVGMNYGTVRRLNTNKGQHISEQQHSYTQQTSYQCNGPALLFHKDIQAMAWGDWRGALEMCYFLAFVYGGLYIQVNRMPRMPDLSLLIVFLRSLLSLRISTSSPKASGSPSRS